MSMTRKDHFDTDNSPSTEKVRVPMKEKNMVNRRSFLLGTGAAVAGAAVVGTRALNGGDAIAKVLTQVAPPARTAFPSGGLVHMIASDGWAAMPAGAPSIPGFWPDSLAPSPQNVYTFGFRDATDFVFNPANNLNGQSLAHLTIPNYGAGPLAGAFKGKAQISAPTLTFKQGQPVLMRLTNLGLAIRPDLVDGHTLHWHGFRNAIPLFDGVPELSVSAPILGTLEYAYLPHEAGTYMYHCHFEDVEHVQMGMVGMLYVRPSDFDGAIPALRKAYAHPATQYDREYPFMLNELWAEGHWRDAHIQTTDWTTYDPSFFLMNGRAYPDTTVGAGGFDPATGAPNAGLGALDYQPISSLIKCKPGERVLLRMANLGFQNHAITADGIEFTVIGKDAGALINGTHDLTYTTNVVDIAPGESYDVLFTAPASGTYRVYDRNYQHNANNGAGIGGMQTLIVVDSATAAPTFTYSGRQS
jgi:FtsP/CotA-like multicopper oxidase with cupredoxin domain